MNIRRMLCAAILLSVLPLLAVNSVHANNIWVFAPGAYVATPPSFPYPAYGYAGFTPGGYAGLIPYPYCGSFDGYVIGPSTAWVGFDAGWWYFSGTSQFGSVSSAAFMSYQIMTAFAAFQARLYVYRLIPSPSFKLDVWVNYYHPTGIWQDGPGPFPARGRAIDLEVTPYDRSIIHIGSPTGNLFSWTNGAYYFTDFRMWASGITTNAQAVFNGSFKDFNWFFLQDSPLEPLAPVNVSISLSPPVGPVGTNVQVNGTGFAPASPITVSYDNASVASTISDGSGNFTASFAVPSSGVGPHVVGATDGAGNQSFTVFNVYIPSSPLKADLNGDGVVNILDAIILANDFSHTDPNMDPSAVSTQVVTYSGIGALATIGAVAPTAYVLHRKKDHAKRTSEKSTSET